MDKKIHGVDGAYRPYTGSLDDSVLAGSSIGDSHLMGEPPPATKFGPTRQLPHPNTHHLRRRYSVQIPNLPGVDISREAVQQLRGFYETANRNAVQGIPLDQRHVSLIAQGYVGPDDRLMIDGFDARRHLTNTQRTVVQGSRWGGGLLSLTGAIIGGILYTQNNATGAYGVWMASLIALWPAIETQVINRFCKEHDPILMEQGFDPAPERQYQV
ncbi:MAG: hypothetical protein LBB17_02310 [Puniceicoccales bacterium]|nr:hypothetical protein [Puniceicoccales bacterium]